MLAWPSATILSLDLHGQGIGSQNVAENRSQPDYMPLASGDLFRQYPLYPNSPPGRTGADVMKECENVAEAQLLNMPCEASDTGSDGAAPRSNHVGGVNATNIDGSARFLSDEIDVPLLGLLIHISDGLITSE